jgi:hypothetical protein
LPQKGDVRKKRKEKKKDQGRWSVATGRGREKNKKRKEKKKTKAGEKVAPAKARFRVPYTKNSLFGSRVLGLRSSPSWLKYRLLPGYEEAMCEGSFGNGLLYAAKAVPVKDYFTHLLSESSTIKGLLYAS